MRPSSRQLEFVDIRRGRFTVYPVAMEMSIFTLHGAQRESYCRPGCFPLDLSPVEESLTRAEGLFQAGQDFERSAIFISSSVRKRQTGEEENNNLMYCFVIVREQKGRSIDK